MTWLISLFAAHLLHASTDPSAYVHLRVVGDTFQDVNPRMQGGPLPRAVPMSSTRMHAMVGLYFNPTDLAAPAFMEATYNVRRTNHAIVEFQTGARLVLFTSVADFAADLRKVIEYSRLAAASRGLTKADYSEPQFEAGFTVASAMDSAGTSVSARPAGRDVIGMASVIDLAFPLAAVRGAQPLGRLDFRIQHDHFSNEQRAMNILYHRRFSGSAELLPLTPEDHAKVAQLGHLAAPASCAGNVSRQN